MMAVVQPFGVGRGDGGMWHGVGGTWIQECDVVRSAALALTALFVAKPASKNIR